MSYNRVMRQSTVHIYLFIYLFIYFYRIAFLPSYLFITYLGIR